MCGMFLTPLTMFLQLQSRLDRLLVLRGVVVQIMTLGALEFDKIVLGHTYKTFNR